MSKNLEIMTCNNCGFDNPDNSKKCNKCGITLLEVTKGGVFSSDTYKCNYTRRWVCSKCGAKNMSENNKCHSCLSKKSSWF